MEANEVIEGIRQRYCMCSSYHDEGFVEMRRSGNLTALIEFKTFYRQPNQFRFEFRKNAPLGGLMTFSVCRNRNECISHCPGMEPAVSQSDLNFAIAGVTGVSLGTAVHIPPLLMPSIKTHRLIDYEEYKLVEDESGSESHFHVVEMHEQGTRTRMYVRKEDFSICRIARDSTTTNTDESIAQILERLPEAVRKQYVEVLESDRFTQKMQEPTTINYEYRKAQFNIDIKEEEFQFRLMR